jgi:dihydrolipoamide dehydrogenase
MVDKILMAVGRRPYTKGLDLENAGIKDTQKGIKVNAMMQTDVEDIYAIGDVTNIIQLAHVASHQGIIAVENIAGNQNHLMNYDAVPCAIFTHPEIASVGLTEKGAAQQNLSVTVGKFPYAANGKALAMGDDQGFIKVIADKASKKVLGATIVGLNAADLIATLTVSVQNGLTTEQLAKTIFAHPTTAEVIHESVLATEGGALHFID